MSKTPKSIFICQSCGHESPRWSGRCPQCSEWNAFVETAVSPSNSKLKTQISNLNLNTQSLNEVAAGASDRIATGISEFDRVLGSGIVPGSVILLAGEPGVGKSTLLLQVATAVTGHLEDGKTDVLDLDSLKSRSLDQDVKRSKRQVQEPQKSPFFKKSSPYVLYVSGEESPSQLKLRADRLGIKAGGIQVLSETNVDAIVRLVENRGQTSVLGHRSRLPSSDISLLMVDSVQTLVTGDLSAPAGSISQVRECSQRLAAMAKEKNIPLILVGHVTKAGSIAGPKVLEHMVDTVLYLEGDRFHSFRLLRAKKNRYGSDQEVGVFAMGDRGLSEVKNPSDAFLKERSGTVPGNVVTATMEGARPVLVEIQALATNTPLAYPRRTASGLGLNRLNLLVAVLQKHLKLPLQNKDIYVNVAGGFKVTEPAADLAAALAIVSSVKDSPIDPQTCVFGEVGLSGEVRKVSQSERRIKEATKLGFKKIISPESVRSLREALKAINNQPHKPLNE